MRFRADMDFGAIDVSVWPSHQCVCIVMGCLHDPANVQQTSSKCIQNTRASVGRLPDVCQKFAWSCKHPTCLQNTRTNTQIT